MPDAIVPVFIPELRQALAIPAKGLTNRIVQNDDRSKVVLYGLAAGHEMSLHAAPVPTMLYFLEGDAILTLGDETMTVGAGAFTCMPPHLKHAIAASSPVLMLLIMLK